MCMFVFIMPRRRSKSKVRAKGDSECSTPSGQRENESNITRKMRDKCAVNELTIVGSPSDNCRNNDLSSDQRTRVNTQKYKTQLAIQGTKKKIWRTLSPALKALRQRQLESDNEKIELEKKRREQGRKTYCDGCKVSLRL